MILFLPEATSSQDSSWENAVPDIRTVDVASDGSAEMRCAATVTALLWRALDLYPPQAAQIWTR
jgi:hypothetical protein